MLIQKTLKFDEVALKMQGDSGTFEGYASKWNGVDSHGDTILKGAFSETLKAAPSKHCLTIRNPLWAGQSVCNKRGTRAQLQRCTGQDTG